MSIRLRLCILYAAVTAAFFLPAALLAYGIHVRGQYDDLDRGLVDAAEHFYEEAGGSSGPAPRPLAGDIHVRIYDARGSGSGPTAADPPLTLAALGGRDDGPAYPSLVRLLPASEVRATGAFATVRDPSTGSRVRVYGTKTADGGTVVTWKSLQDRDESTRFLAVVLIAATLAGVALAGAGSYAVAGNVLRPVGEITDAARTIASSRDFGRRLDIRQRGDELGRLAETFDEMLANLEEAYRSQQRFVADAAHELRAPLTAIQGNLELLRGSDEMPAEDRAEALAYVDTEATRLSRIVTELLTLARADAGMSLGLRPVELDRVVLDALADMTKVAINHKLALEDVEPVMVAGDADRLKQLVLNLLDNSVKYTPAGGYVGVAVRRAGDQATLTVRDSGHGIPDEDRPHVFERFYRADPARGHDPGGTGLGLAIASWIVDQHAGAIGIESRPGRGTVVTVTIPLLARTEAQRADASPAGPKVS